MFNLSISSARNEHTFYSSHTYLSLAVGTKAYYKPGFLEMCVEYRHINSLHFYSKSYLYQALTI